jgi:hypothetical protein
MQQQAFDNYAVTYDEDFTHSSIGNIQRNQVYKNLDMYVNFNQCNILEINCGTGEDAVWMATKNAKVLATDISQGMINVATSKAISRNLPINFMKLDIKQLSLLHQNKYDFILSNFGGLNCLSADELEKLEGDCSILQNKNSRLALVIMSEKCCWERLYYSFKKDKLNLNRRKTKNGFDTMIDNIRFKTYYYSPSKVKEIFKKNYALVTLKPIGLFVPPSYLGNYFKDKKWLLNIFDLFDSFFSRFSVFANYADHYLIILEKK